MSLSEIPLNIYQETNIFCPVTRCGRNWFIITVAMDVWRMSGTSRHLPPSIKSGNDEDHIARVFSQRRISIEVRTGSLAWWMRKMNNTGCHNLCNIAVEKGFCIVLCEDNFIYFLVTLYTFYNLFTFFNYVIRFYFFELHILFWYKIKVFFYWIWLIYITMTVFKIVWKMVLRLVKCFIMILIWL